MFRTEASARETHSSIDNVAAGQESDVASDREWMAGIGCRHQGLGQVEMWTWRGGLQRLGNLRLGSTYAVCLKL